MNQSEAEQIYSYHLKRTEELINSMGNNPQAINAFITNTYVVLSQKDPAFLWFSLGTVVSSTVGRNLQAATQTIVNSAGQVESAKIVLENLSVGNQAIFKNIVPLFLTYESIGVEGIELLKNSDIQNPYKNKFVLDAMKNYSALQAQQAAIASKLDLNLNDSKVITQLFSNKENIDIAHSLAMGIANEEQSTVQKIYKTELLDVLLDPTLGWLGHQLKLDEIKILDKTYNLFDYIDNPADFDQRIAFAEILLSAIDEGISKGDFVKYQADTLKMAELTLWMANPHTAPQAIGEINGAYWGYQADEHDKKVKESVLTFLNPDSSTQEPAAITPINDNEQNIFPSVFTGDHEIVKVNVDPLALFLANNPNYEVIAHNVSDITNSPLYNHMFIPGRGMAYWNHALPYLQNGTTLDVQKNGSCYYYQPYGEVRGVTFPFMYDKTTGVPLTMPIVDTLGNYNHASTIDTIYNNPEAFNTHSHVNWYNPYWTALVRESAQKAMNDYLKSISVDKFMDAVLAPPPSAYKSFSYDSTSGKAQIKGSDIFHNNSGNIDFSSLKGAAVEGGHSYKAVITSMELANGTRFEVDSNSGNFTCVNCTNHSAILLEPAANEILRHI